MFTSSLVVRIVVRAGTSADATHGAGGRQRPPNSIPARGHRAGSFNLTAPFLNFYDDAIHTGCHCLGCSSWKQRAKLSIEILAHARQRCIDLCNRLAREKQPEIVDDCQHASFPLRGRHRRPPNVVIWSSPPHQSSSKSSPSSFRACPA